MQPKVREQAITLRPVQKSYFERLCQYVDKALFFGNCFFIYCSLSLIPIEENKLHMKLKKCLSSCYSTFKSSFRLLTWVLTQ